MLDGARTELSRGSRRAWRRVRRSEAHFRALIEHSSDVVVLVGPDSTVRYTAPSITALLGYAEDELIGRRLTDVVHRDDEIPFLSLQERVVKGDAPEPLVARWRHANGGWRTFESIHRNLLAEPEVRSLVINARDITERRQLEDRLSHYAFHDPLTGLANRALFRDRLDHALRRATRTDSRPAARGFLAVLACDLDDFKAVNDRLGHATGDALLVEVAARLAAEAGPSTTLARMGSDEFGLLVEDVVDVAEVEVVAQRVIGRLAKPFVLGAESLDLGISVGVVNVELGVAHAGEDDVDEVLRNAEVAIHLAKGAGKGRCVVFDPSMREAFLGRLEMKADLERALANDEFVVQYQPEVELATGQVVAMEALVRWQHPTRGLVPPLDFIPLAEETGAIVAIGRFVLRQACLHVRRLQQGRTDRSALSVSVNLSARELEEPNLVESVAAVLDETGLEPSCLVLEITESLLVADVRAAASRLTALSALGVRLAIDDFGTGYSSLSYLEDLPVHILKIDKSFVDRLGQGDEPVMVRAITQLAHALQLELVAEGIEHRQQARELDVLGCRLGQGFYFARPVDGPAISGLLERTFTSDEASSTADAAGQLPTARTGATTPVG